MTSGGDRWMALMLRVSDQIRSALIQRNWRVHEVAATLGPVRVELRLAVHIDGSRSVMFQGQMASSKLMLKECADAVAAEIHQGLIRVTTFQRPNGIFKWIDEESVVFRTRFDSEDDEEKDGSTSAPSATTGLSTNPIPPDDWDGNDKPGRPWGLGTKFVRVSDGLVMQARGAIQCEDGWYVALSNLEQTVPDDEIDAHMENGTWKLKGL